MGATRRFLSSPREASIVLDWFQQLPDPPTVFPKPHGALLYFKGAGPLGYHPDNSIDVAKSPLGSIFVPQERRGFLWTVGEVHFLPTPLNGAFPPLDRVCKRFTSWLRQFPLVFSRANGFAAQWNYFLEGGIRNRDGEIFALPEGMQALDGGRYFVAYDDNERYVDNVVKMLRLRGIDIA